MSELPATSIPAIPDIKVDIIDVNADHEYSFPESSKSLLVSLQEHKKAVLISVPGAFTPTCSEKHLPGFIEHFDALNAKGITLMSSSYFSGYNISQHKVLTYHHTDNMFTIFLIHMSCIQASRLCTVCQ